MATVHENHHANFHADTMHHWRTRHEKKYLSIQATLERPIKAIVQICDMLRSLPLLTSCDQTMVNVKDTSSTDCRSFKKKIFLTNFVQRIVKNSARITV